MCYKLVIMHRGTYTAICKHKPCHRIDPSIPTEDKHLKIPKEVSRIGQTYLKLNRNHSSNNQSVGYGANYTSSSLGYNMHVVRNDPEYTRLLVHKNTTMCIYTTMWYNIKICLDIFTASNHHATASQPSPCIQTTPTYGLTPPPLPRPQSATEWMGD